VYFSSTPFTGDTALPNSSNQESAGSPYPSQ
jgi:hypothetical protein